VGNLLIYINIYCLLLNYLSFSYQQINKPAAFTVDFNGAQGKLDARVVAPSGAEDEAIIQEVDKGLFT